jgi:uncharacterized RDD family membrane protein YckC
LADEELIPATEIFLSVWRQTASLAANQTKGSMTFYYAVNGQQTGPVTEEELRQMVAGGALAADTLVWREGMAEWQPFSTAIGGLAGATQAAVECSVCHQKFPADQTIQYGNATVCAGCKPRLVQGLREGASAPGHLDYANSGARAVAKILDQILLYVVQFIMNMTVFAGMAAAAAPTGGRGAPPDMGKFFAYMAMMMVVNLSIYIGYQAFLLHWRGQTLGKMALGIKVVTPDGGPLSWGKCIGRPAAEMLSSCILLIGYFMAFWDPEKRTLHDRLAGTRVIKVAK